MRSRILLGLGVLATVLGNWLILHRRFAPGGGGGEADRIGLHDRMQLVCYAIRRGLVEP